MDTSNSDNNDNDNDNIDNNIDQSQSIIKNKRDTGNVRNKEKGQEQEKGPGLGLPSMNWMTVLNIFIHENHV